MKIYAGIGSRETPKSVLLAMSTEAQRRAKEGWLLRSGGANGADEAFAAGAMAASGAIEIYRPYHSNTTSDKLAIQVIEELNKVQNTNLVFEKMKPYTQQLISRNMQIVLGEKLDTPVNEILCWTKNGDLTGGTRYAIMLGRMLAIPITNYGCTQLKNI